MILYEPVFNVELRKYTLKSGMDNSFINNNKKNPMIIEHSHKVFIVRKSRF